MKNDSVVRVTLKHGKNTYPTRWYYNLSKKESVKRCKRFCRLTGKHNVIVEIV